MAKRCFGCMRMKEKAPICEHCGYDERTKNSDHQLPVGTVLGGQYMIGKALGQGGFGITYLAWDQVMNQLVAVKEYFPKGFASRTVGNTNVTSYDGQNAHDFEFNKQRFLREAESLAKLWNIPQIVKILRYFEENGTAYIVMEYVEGINLRDHIRRQGRPLTMDEILLLIDPIVAALELVHKIHLVHRDISPDNIMVLPDGSTKLLDFGAARYVENANAEQERLTSTQAILKHGFAPPEQYRSHGALGPWTDEYAMCATIYYCITGRIPTEAMARTLDGEAIDWSIIRGLTPRQKAALEKGLSLQPKDRFSSVEELWEQLKPVLTVKPEEPKSAPKPKRKLAAFIAAILSVTIGTGVFFGIKAADTSNFIYEENEIGWTIKGVEGSEADQSGPLVLPEKYKGKVVTAIGDSAFENYRSITEISIPDTVTSIGNRAFSGCSSLTSVTIPDGVTSLGNETFSDCNSLTSVTIPDGVTSLGNETFSDCNSLASVTIPDGVTSLGNKTFSDCNSLTSVTIPDGVTSLGNETFSDCNSLTSVTIPDSVTSIGIATFSGCSSLTSMTIPDGITSIGNETFSDCTSLTSVTIPDSVTSIGGYAFYDCRSLSSVIIPESITSIGIATFYGCSSLTNVIIPDSVTSIGYAAFYGCSNLDSVIISNSVTAIESSVFSGCSSLTNVTIPDSVTSIGNYAFQECSSLSSVTIPDSVTSIGERAFSGCSSLTSVTIPDSVMSIGFDAFSDCSGLTRVVIPDSVTFIDSYAFSGCSSLASVTIHRDCKIGYGVFPDNCKIYYR